MRAAELASRAGRTSAGFEWLFWGVEVARPSSFRAAFAARVEQTSGEHAGATLRYPDGDFEVHFGRMPLLAALMEFLVSFLGYRAVAETATRLAADGASRQTISTIANDLARQLYAALREHLPTAQAQRKFHAMTLYLQQAAGEDFTARDIDDQAVLDFWLACSASDGGTGLRLVPNSR